MTGRSFLLALAALACAFLQSCAPAEERGPVVLAASSMQEALGAAADDWAAHGHPRPVLSFASSSAVARQVSEGAPADLVVTSDDRWMRWLEERDALAGSPVPLVRNALVVVAPVDGDGPGSLAELAADPDGGRLAMGEPESVPAGEFARDALQNMGLWDELSPRIAPGENVRASLALVERGEAALGVVYASDAAASRRVRVVELIDADAHPPIVYYAAQVAGAGHEDTAAFLDYLTSSRGRRVLVTKGFAAP